MSLGLDGDYWVVSEGRRERKPTANLILESFISPEKPKMKKKKRAPLTEEQKKRIAERSKRRMELKRVQDSRRKEQEAILEQERMNYLLAKETVQREGIEIYDGIFVGGKLSAMNYDLLKKRNVKGILNVTNEVRLYFEDTDEFDYLRIPADDHHDEPLKEQFTKGSEFIDSIKDGNVLVHCKMGQSRSCTMLVAHGMVSLGWSLKKTIEHLHSVHACVGINDGFKRQLMAFEEELFGFSSWNFFNMRRSQSDVGIEKESISDNMEIELSKESEPIQEKESEIQQDNTNNNNSNIVEVSNNPITTQPKIGFISMADITPLTTNSLEHPLVNKGTNTKNNTEVSGKRYKDGDLRNFFASRLQN